jgi:hypothetical protein
MKNNTPLSEDFLYDNPCQEGYIAYGTKIKDGREVPNCVPVNQSQNFADELNYEVTTVVMESNRYIPRRDEMGELYYQSEKWRENSLKRIDTNHLIMNILVYN